MNLFPSLNCFISEFDHNIMKHSQNDRAKENFDVERAGDRSRQSRYFSKI